MRTVHFLVFVVFSAQAAVYGLLSNSFSYTIRYVSLSAAGEAVVSSVAEIRLSTLVAAYFAVAAFHHLLVVLPGVFSVYTGCLERRTNPFRWFEVGTIAVLACASSPSNSSDRLGQYIVSATIMIVILALILGIQDIVVIGLLATCMASCNSLGFAFERARSGTSKSPSTLTARSSPYSGSLSLLPPSAPSFSVSCSLFQVQI